MLENTNFEKWQLHRWLREKFASGCGSRNLGNYHSWNNVFYSKSGAERTEFQNLTNVGKCIVKKERLPKMFADWTYSKIQEKLDDHARLVNQTTKPIQEE